MNSCNIANIFKVLGDKNRVEILCLLKNGELCACDLLENLDISQSTLSHHMKMLISVGIVDERKDSKWTFYSINNITMKDINKVLDSLTSCKNQRKAKNCK